MCCQKLTADSVIWSICRADRRTCPTQFSHQEELLEHVLKEELEQAFREPGVRKSPAPADPTAVQRA